MLLIGVYMGVIGISGLRNGHADTAAISNNAATSIVMAEVE